MLCPQKRLVAELAGGHLDLVPHLSWCTPFGLSVSRSLSDESTPTFNDARDGFHSMSMSKHALAPYEGQEHVMEASHDAR